MLRNLQLDRPLVSLDLETTSLNGARIVELAMVRLDPTGRTMSAVVYRVNPGEPISESASRLHGITDEDVAACPPFLDLVDIVVALLAGADIAGFNVKNFDLAVLANEMIRADRRVTWQGARVLDTMRIYHLIGRPSRLDGRRDLARAVRDYLGRPHYGAHGALADALAVVELLDAQVLCHELPRTVAELELAIVRAETIDCPR